MWFSARKVGIVLSVIVGNEGQLPSLPKQWQPASQTGTTLFEKTPLAFVCAGICRMRSSCKSRTEIPTKELAEIVVEVVMSTMVATGMLRSKRRRKASVRGKGCSGGNGVVSMLFGYLVSTIQ